MCSSGLARQNLRLVRTLSTTKIAATAVSTVDLQSNYPPAPKTIKYKQQRQLKALLQTGKAINRNQEVKMPKFFKHSRIKRQRPNLTQESMYLIHLVNLRDFKTDRIVRDQR